MSAYLRLENKEILSNWFILEFSQKSDAKTFMFDAFNPLTGRLNKYFKLEQTSIEGEFEFKGLELKGSSVLLTYDFFSGDVRFFSNVHLLELLGIAINNNVTKIENNFILLHEDLYATSYDLDIKDGIKETLLDISYALGKVRK